jgi:glycosyltransferase involved in cell wall biosynthesis
MKVAILTSFPTNPLAPRGGVEAVSVNLVEALTRRPGLELHVITADRACEAPAQIDWNGATIHRLPMGGGRLLRFVLGAGRAEVLERISQIDPDVIHAHDFYGIMVKGLPVPRVFTVHGFIHEDTRFSGGWLAWLRAQMWKRHELAAWADQPHIISISPYVRERLAGIARGAIHEIENPIDARVFEIERRENEGTIFCAAVISPRKNTLGLVKAFAKVARRHPNAQLRLAGSAADEGYLHEVERCIAENSLSERVQLLGSLSTEEIRAELSRASIFALLSFEEGAPMGISEAMAAGVPVVTSNRCGMPYMVSDGKSGFLVDPHEPQEAADRFDELLSQVELRQRLGANARAFALERFHPDRVAEGTERVYQIATEETTPPPKGLSEPRLSAAGVAR